jgi:hypothetical protein
LGIKIQPYRSENDLPCLAAMVKPTTTILESSAHQRKRFVWLEEQVQ